MSLPSWPSGVPSDPRRESWKIPQPVNKPDITEFEAGNSRARPRGSVQYRVIDQAIRMTQAEFALFDAFVRSDLVNGTKRFTMPVWNGFEKQTKTVRLRGEAPFSVAPKGTALLISMSLEVAL